MVEKAQEIEVFLNAIVDGRHTLTTVKCPKCPKWFNLSNFTDRDKLLNHMLGHFYAES